MRPAAADGMGQVGHADAAAHLGVEQQWYVAPLGRAGPPHPHHTAKDVGVRHTQRPFGAVDLDARQVGVPHVEAGDQRCHRPGGEVQQRGHVGGHLHGQAAAVMLAAGGDPLRERGAGRAGHPMHRPQQVDQAGQVIGGHIQQRAAAGLVEEIGVGVPPFRAMAGHEGHGRHRLPDPAVVDQFAAGLLAAAQEGIGRAADAHALLSGRVQDLLAFGAAHGQRLLAVDVLVRGDSRQADGRVYLGHGQVDHDLDLRVGQQRVHAQRARHAVFGGLLAGAAGVDISHSSQIENGEGPAARDVSRKDLAHANDADLDLLRHGPGPPAPDSGGSARPQPAYPWRNGPARRSTTARRWPRPRWHESPARPAPRQPWGPPRWRDRP